MQYKKIAIIGGYTLVSPEHTHLIEQYDWFVDRDGYATAFDYSNDKVRSVRLHRLILPPCGTLCVDHSNRVRLDNRRSNLELVTWQQQCANRGQQIKDEHTPYLDVELRKSNVITDTVPKRIRFNDLQLKEV